MNEREYERLKKQIVDDCAEKLRALEIVWEMARVDARPAAIRSGPKKGEVMEAVRSAVNVLTGDFTQKDVTSAVLSIKPDTPLNRASVVSALRRLADDDVITTVEAGKGKRPSVFRRTS
jgi:hypothetical protein